MAFHLTSSAHEAAVHGVKMLVYAEAGTGKTMLMPTAPRPFLISAESGLLSLSKKNIERVCGVDMPDITYDVPTAIVRNIDDLNDVYRWCTTSEEAAAYDTFGLDSITEIAEVILSAAKAVAKDPRQAYGDLIEKMTTTLKSFRDIQGRHVYMSAKMEPNKDEMTGIVKYGPSMPGTKLGPQLPYLFDEVFRLGIGADQQTKVPFRYLLTQPDLQYVAKDRSGSLDVWEAPNLTNIINKITQGGQ